MSARLHRLTDRGQSLVEFALVLPIFILLLVGILDFGRAIYAYNTISNAAREAARVAIVDQDPAAIRAEAIKQAVSLDLIDADVTIAYANADLTTGAPCNVAAPPNGCVVSVTVDYSYEAATPILGNIVGTIDLSSTTRMPIERSNP